MKDVYSVIVKLKKKEKELNRELRFCDKAGHEIEYLKCLSRLKAVSGSLHQIDQQVLISPISLCNYVSKYTRKPRKFKFFKETKANQGAIRFTGRYLLGYFSKQSSYYAYDENGIAHEGLSVYNIDETVFADLLRSVKYDDCIVVAKGNSLVEAPSLNHLKEYNFVSQFTHPGTISPYLDAKFQEEAYSVVKEKLENLRIDTTTMKIEEQKSNKLF